MKVPLSKRCPLFAEWSYCRPKNTAVVTVKWTQLFFEETGGKYWSLTDTILILMNYMNELYTFVLIRVTLKVRLTETQQDTQLCDRPNHFLISREYRKTCFRTWCQWTAAVGSPSCTSWNLGFDMGCCDIFRKKNKNKKNLTKLKVPQGDNYLRCQPATTH